MAGDIDNRYGEPKINRHWRTERTLLYQTRIPPMNCRLWNRSLVVFVCGSLFGAFLCALLDVNGNNQGAAHAAQDSDMGMDLAALQRDIETLSGKVPSQSHSMMDIDYHFTNLWFAGKAENWPLADFYWKETLSHLHWAVRIIPIRKDNAGQDVMLNDLLKGVEQSPFMQVGKTIEDQDPEKFETAYRFTLEGCYACHKASDKPYLRPKIPSRPASVIINFDPNATWPK